MNCQTFESLVNDLAGHLGGQELIEANLREQALAHTADCGVCALRLQDERVLAQGLRALAMQMENEQAPAHIEAELRAAFRNHKSTEMRPSAIRDWRYWATAAAAVLLIVLGIVAMRSGPAREAAQNPVSPVSIESQQPRETASAENTRETPRNKEETKAAAETNAASPPKRESTLSSRYPKRSVQSTLAKPKSARNGRKNALATGTATTIAANYNENEIATDFLPVGYVNSTSLQDGGELMRVELPRSALARFGLPVNMDRANERVKADVLLGPDGQARAIRFVQ